MVDRHIAGASSYKEVDRDDKMELVTTMGQEGDVALTVTFLKAKGLTMEEIKTFHAIDDQLSNTHNHIDKIISGHRLEDYQGVPLLYQHIKTPIMVSNRCAFLSATSGQMSLMDLGSSCRLLLAMRSTLKSIKIS